MSIQGNINQIIGTAGGIAGLYKLSPAYANRIKMADIDKRIAENQKAIEAVNSRKLGVNISEEGDKVTEVPGAEQYRQNRLTELNEQRAGLLEQKGNYKGAEMLRGTMFLEQYQRGLDESAKETAMQTAQRENTLNMKEFYRQVRLGDLNGK